MSKRLFVSVLGVLFAAGAVVAAEASTPSRNDAQAAPATAAAQEFDGGVPAFIREETPEQRKTRLGTPEDPGLDPDPKKKWWRFGREFFIEKYDRRWARYDREPGTVRPLGMVNFAYEIYQQNEKWVWVWMPVPPTKEEIAATLEEIKAHESGELKAPRRSAHFNEMHIEFFGRIRPQFSELTPEETEKTVRFAPASEGLPTAGSWRNTLAVADMNGDGFKDLVAPPERGGRGTGQPAIFLGDGKGKWTYWDKVKWPRDLDYGGVAAADFNKDGHQDLAFGVHLRGIYIFLGDGKGNFVDVEDIPREYATRRVAVADLDRDGFMDVVAISEGPTQLTDDGASDLRGYLNRKKGRSWEVIELADPKLKMGGDWLTVANLNGDQAPDFIASSNWQGSQSIVHLSEGQKKWKDVASDGDVIPSMSYYFASASGKFSSKKRDDAIISYVRYWPDTLEEHLVARPPMMATTNIDRITWENGTIKRHPIYRWAGIEGIRAMGSGDLDGDGNEDVVYTRYNPREAGILFGDGKGGFTRGRLEGIEISPNVNYDVKITDLNGDKRPDVVLMYETGGTTALSPRDGAINVFLNQGSSAQGVARAE